MKRRHSGQEEESAIDLTPMLDVVFIMLIFFIVTASFVKEFGIEIKRPDASENPNPPDEDSFTIVVEVREANDIYMENRRIDIRQIRPNIERLHAEHPEAPLIVQAHPGSNSKIFVTIADAARESSVLDVSLAELK